MVTGTRGNKRDFSFFSCCFCSWTLLRRIVKFYIFGVFVSKCGAPVTMRMAKCAGTVLTLLCAVVLSPAQAAHAVYPRIRLSHKGKEAAGRKVMASPRRLRQPFGGRVGAAIWAPH